MAKSLHLVRLRIEVGQGTPLEVDTKGGRLLDICDEIPEAAGSPVPFSCRDANCGACRIVVLAGAHLLERPEEREQWAFRAQAPEVAGGGEVRLACCAVVRPEEGVLHIRPVGRGE